MNPVENPQLPGGPREERQRDSAMASGRPGRGNRLVSWLREPPVLLVSLAVGCLLRVLYASRPHVCFGDESCYLWLARNLFAGEGYSYYAGIPEVHFPPLFPCVLGVIHAVVPNWEVVSRIAYVLFGSILPLPIYLLGRDLYGPRTARFAALIAAVLPALTAGVLFAETLSEPLYIFWLFTGLWLLFRAWTRRRLGLYALVGACLSLAYLTRPEAFLFLGSSVAFVLLAGFLERRPPTVVWRTAAILSMVATFLLVAAPYLVYLRHHTGTWTLTTKGTTTYILTRPLVRHDGVAFQELVWGLNEEGEVRYYGQEFDDSLAALILGPYRDEVPEDVRANLANLRNLLLRPWVAGPGILGLAVLGLFGKPWSRRRLRGETLNLLVVLPHVSLLVLYVNERFVYAMLLPLILWAAVGIRRIFAWIARTEFPAMASAIPIRRAIQAAVFVGLIAYLLGEAQLHFQSLQAQRSEVWVAADIVARNTPAGATVMATGPEVAFHADRTWLPVPVASPADVVAYGLRRNASYLCLRRRYLELRPEQKRDLFDRADDPTWLAELRSWGLELVYRSPVEERAMVVVYRLRKP